MPNERRPPMEISWRDDTLPDLARRYDLDLIALADEALRERMLRDPILSFTPRMLSVVLRAQEEARRLGHTFIGTEHVFLATLIDEWSLPSQLLKDMGVVDDVIQQVRAMLTSDTYSRKSREDTST